MITISVMYSNTNNITIFSYLAGILIRVSRCGMKLGQSDFTSRTTIKELRKYTEIVAVWYKSIRILIKFFGFIADGHWDLIQQILVYKYIILKWSDLSYMYLELEIIICN